MADRTAEQGGDQTDLPPSVPLVLERAAARFAGREALVDGDLRLTFEGLLEQADQAARALLASGIQPGERVAIWAPNRAEWAIAALGTYRAGGVVVPLNTRFKGHEAAYILQRSGARLLFTVTDFLDTDYVELLRDHELPALGETIVMGGAVPGGCSGWQSFLGRGEAIDRSQVAERVRALGSDDVCDILFTSGTTGRPKGAMLTHGASIRAYDSWASVVGLREGDRYLIVNPFFHAFGLKAGILACLLKGATIIPHPVFDVPSLMRRVAQERVTMLPGPPAIYQTILDHPDLASYDLSTLRLAVTGAATVPVEMIRRMRDELTFTTIVTGYGLTEATGIATMCRHDDDPETIAHTAGRPIPGVEVKLVDERGRSVPIGEPGEVLVRGYNVMKGYLDDPEATAAAIDPDGWLRTGDIGVLDEQGNLRITDRLKDMFIVGGFNAYPAEIENIMMEHPSVAQVAVVGVPDHRLGEVGKAFVIPRPGAEIDPDALIGWCRERMANFKVPRSVEVVEAFPLNASGKVLKYELRDRSG
ncbi:FadD3 family acyl-CoA ligase [Rhabdothermincola sp.]|uniref:FadD3 family acyl-CoA ligase n=1 Tax=Rhabdothermincola sp. TaxID=2820405 RepID=UPI002FE1DFAA